MNGQCEPCVQCDPPCQECYKCVNGECVYDFDACPTCESLYGEWQLTVNWCGMTGIATNVNPGFFVDSAVDPPEGTCAATGIPGVVSDYKYIATVRFRYIANDGQGVVTHGWAVPGVDPDLGTTPDLAGCNCIGGFRLFLAAPSDCPGNGNPGGQFGWSLYCTRGYRAYVCDGELVEILKYPDEPSTFGLCTSCEDEPTVTLAFGGAP